MPPGHSRSPPGLLFFWGGRQPRTRNRSPSPARADLLKGADMLEKFAEVHLGDEIDTLDAADRKVVENAIEAARALDAIFWKQTWSGAVALRDRLAAANDRRRLEEVLLMYGPYDRLEDHRPFLDNVPTRPQGAAFYPDDMTREEFERWIADHPEDREAFESLTSLIRRDGDRLVATPYRTAFQDELGRAADALRAAADASTNESLATYLRARAEALLSDEYYESDLAWMDVENNSVDVTIGPYETYEDMLFGYKAAYEAYVGVVDAQESANLQTYARYLDDMDKKLAALCPYNIHRGAASPIRVINLIYNAGDARAGVQTTAFNLPNDERVHQARGTRKVMLRNVARAKFQKSMIPLAERLLASSDLGHVTFNAYFTNVLLHEMSHSLGPSFIGFNGTQTTVRKALKDQYSAVEEAKADIGGLYFHQWL
ncbi:MAG: peptidase, partial [Armatimonadetes bacterium]|nr:peptidase [Armatimonadota bacterium]